jgi:PhnB protein
MTMKTGNCFVQSYLFFNGRCEEAIAFYGKALGAELEFLMRFNESPEPLPAGMVPPGFQDKIMHCTFRIGATTLMASDDCTADQPKFAGFSLALSFSSKEEAERAFAALAEGGQVRMPLTKTFWSPCFGTVEDRFGMGWMISVTAPQ